MVQNSEWGPPLWRLLHTLAEQIGRQTIGMLAIDESRAWLQFLRTTELVMPCKLCRRHYREWRTAHPLESLNVAGRDPSSREWLWGLHEDVNARRGVQSGVRLEDMERLYGSRESYELQQDIATLSEIFQRAIYAGLVEGQAVRDWKTKLVILRKLIGYA
jgi:Erv1 / Alr family